MIRQAMEVIDTASELSVAMFFVLALVVFGVLFRNPDR